MRISLAAQVVISNITEELQVFHGLRHLQINAEADKKGGLGENLENMAMDALKQFCSNVFHLNYLLFKHSPYPEYVLVESLSRDETATRNYEAAVEGLLKSIDRLTGDSTEIGILKQLANRFKFATADGWAKHGEDWMFLKINR